jgi:hypothetical protein
MKGRLTKYMTGAKSAYGSSQSPFHLSSDHQNGNVGFGCYRLAASVIDDQCENTLEHRSKPVIDIPD